MKSAIVAIVLLLSGCHTAVTCCEQAKTTITQCNNDCEPNGGVCQGEDVCQTCENECLADYISDSETCGACRE